MFSNLIKNGLNRINLDDKESQSHYIDTICKDVRGIDSKWVKDMDAFFIPNNDYIKHMFGPMTLNEDFDLYNFEGESKWVGCLMFPIYNLVDDIVGLNGYNPFASLKYKMGEDCVDPRYQESSRRVFNKSKYLFCKKGTYLKAVREGTCVLVDGVFDMISLTALGFNAFCFMGSDISIEVATQLKFIKNKVFCKDNDKAGLRLERKLKSYFPDLKSLDQSICKDSDDLIKTNFKSEYINELKKLLDSNINSSIFISGFGRW